MSFDGDFIPFDADIDRQEAAILTKAGLHVKSTDDEIAAYTARKLELPISHPMVQIELRQDSLTRWWLRYAARHENENKYDSIKNEKIKNHS